MFHHSKSAFCRVTQHRATQLLSFAVCAVFLSPNSNAIAGFVSYANETAWKAAAGSTLLENFESYSANTQISSLPMIGVSFDSLAGGGHPQTYSFSGTPHGPMQLGNFPNGINQINRYNDIVLRVLPGYRITALGFWNGDGQEATFFAKAFDASNNYLGQVGAFKGTFAGFTSDVSISHVVFVGNTGDGWNHLDGLQTNAIGAVPEPSSIAMFGGGALGLLFAARKRRQIRLAT